MFIKTSCKHIETKPLNEEVDPIFVWITFLFKYQTQKGSIFRVKNSFLTLHLCPFVFMLICLRQGSGFFFVFFCINMAPQHSNKFQAESRQSYHHFTEMPSVNRDISVLTVLYT